MPKELRVEHSDLFSQRPEAVEYSPSAESDEPVQHPVFSDRDDNRQHGTPS